MESTSLCTSTTSSFLPSPPPRRPSPNSAALPRPPSAAARFAGRRLQQVAVSAAIRRDDNSNSSSWWKPSSSGGPHGGHVVDEGMIVLRKRIGEMKLAEQSHVPPEEWAHWEKQYYAVYGDLVCKSLGAVQRSLMGTRPTVALGACVLLAACVPVSTFAVASRLAEAADGVFSSLGLLG